MKKRAVAAILAGGVCLLNLHGADDVFVGVDTNYSLDMEKEGKTWSWDGRQEDLFRGMAKQGVQGLRVRLWTGNSGTNGKVYATEVVRRGLDAGLDPYLVIFLSDDWADMMKQPVPAIWKDLDLEARCEAVKKYSREIVEHFRKEGLRSHLYEIGNEIDYGICGIYPSKGAKKNAASLSKSCWPDAAKIIRAAEQGVREADPEAKFLLHIAHWWDPDFCVAFFRHMLDSGVQVDYAGLSYFPSSNIGGSLEMKQFGDVVTRLHKEIGRPVIVPETAYPSTADFKGQFSRWKKSVPGYPLTDDGQRQWLKDFLNFCAHHPGIDSVYYWSPEWCGEGMWKAFALFDVNGQARPAWESFSGKRAERPVEKNAAFFEVRGESVYPVPVELARQKAEGILAEKLKQFGRVNVDYIKSITDENVVVDGYRLVLRASLSGNLDLALADPPPKASGKEAIELTPKDEKIVLFADDASSPTVKAAVEYARNSGREVLVHPAAADVPLNFGLSAPTEEAPKEE
jgi:arabinogalactan endo-1,4-beta-galactosidase